MHAHCTHRGHGQEKMAVCMYISSLRVERCPYPCQTVRKRKTEVNSEQSCSGGSNSKEHRGPVKGRISQTDKQTNKQTAEYLDLGNIDMLGSV